MSGRVFLHVGSPKTGTTYLQAILWKHRDRLPEHGVLLPGRSIHAHFRGTLDLREIPERAAEPAKVPGAWRRLVEQSATFDGDAVVSHELLALATAEQAERGVKEFAAAGKEVHVVLTARDIARQLPAEWQERVKHRATLPFGDFIAAIRDPATGAARHLWGSQDYADILRRWGAGLPPANVHVVTVPPPGAPPAVLWERFAGVLGLDPAAFDLDVPRENTSVGFEQAELLRRVNIALGPRLPLPGPYTGVVKGLLAHEVLAERPGTRLVLGGEDLVYARRRSAEMVEQLRHAGYDVVGDLDDLLVPEDAPDPGTSTGRRELDAESLLAEGVEVTADLLTVVAARLAAAEDGRLRLRRELRALRRQALVARGARDRVRAVVARLRRARG